MLSDYRVYFMLLIPIVLNIFFLLRRNPNVRWRVDGDSLDFNPLEAVISFAAFVAIASLMWYLGRNARINDFHEQIGGYVQAMRTQDGSHEVSHESCSGTGDDRTCTTWYETVYHREFFIDYDIGDWFHGNHWSQRVDKSCQSCEPRFVPDLYRVSYIGMPVSFDNTYPNYIAAVNDNVYKATYEGLVARMPDICPETSDIRVNGWQVIRAIPIGFEPTSPLRQLVYDWNFNPSPTNVYMSDRRFDNVPLYMDTMFGYLGKEVQGDTHVYVMNTPVTEYAQMCLAKWKQGAKNSIYVFIFGNSDGTNYTATDVYVGVGVDGTKKNTELQSLNEEGRSNYYMKFDMRNELLDYFQKGGTLDRQQILGIVFRNVHDRFMRQEMATFKQLRDFVQPTAGFISVMWVVLIIVDTFLHILLANSNLLDL